MIQLRTGSKIAHHPRTEEKKDYRFVGNSFLIPILIVVLWLFFWLWQRRIRITYYGVIISSIAMTLIVAMYM